MLIDNLQSAVQRFKPAGLFIVPVVGPCGSNRCRAEFSYPIRIPRKASGERSSNRCLFSGRQPKAYIYFKQIPLSTSDGGKDFNAGSGKVQLLILKFASQPKKLEMLIRRIM